MLDKTTTIIKGESITIKMPSVEEMTLTSLRNCCKKNRVKGYTKMSKEQLVDEVKKIIKGWGKDK